MEIRINLIVLKTSLKIKSLSPHSHIISSIYQRLFQLVLYKQSLLFLLQVAMVITDGKQTRNRDPYEELFIASKNLKARGVQIYSLAIGKHVDRNELENMASSPRNVFQAANFTALKQIVKSINNEICEGKHFFCMLYLDISRLAVKCKK